MLKILQATLQQYLKRELQNVQAGFRKGRGIRYQIGNLHWVIDKARVFQKTSTCLTMQKPLPVSQETAKFLNDGNTRPPYLPSEKLVYRSRSNS